MEPQVELVEGKNCWIAPTKRDARVLAQCLMNQGDMRGFVVTESDQDPYLIVFDSYGNTHYSCIMKLGLGRNARRGVDLEPLIFWKNGGVLVDSMLPRAGRMRASEVYHNNVAVVMDAIAKEIGREYAWVTNDDDLHYVIK